LVWITFKALTSWGSFDTADAMALRESLLGSAGEGMRVTPAASLQNVAVFPAALAGSAKPESTATMAITRTMAVTVRVVVLDTGTISSS
jgi:hypothetical protein